MFRMLIVVLMTVVCTPTFLCAQATYTLVPLPGGLAAGLDQGGSLLAVGTVRSPAPGGASLPAILTEAGPVLINLLEGGTFGQAAGACGPYVVGYSATGPLGLDTHAFLRVEGDPQVHDLGTPGRFSAAGGVNCARQVAGRGEGPEGPAIEALLWDVDGVLRLLERFEAGGTAMAEAINQLGDVTGTTPHGGNPQCALWNAPAYALESCHGPDADGVSIGLGINLSRHVVGAVMQARLPQRGLFRQADGSVTRLDPVAGLNMSQATAVNDEGLVIGTSRNDPDCGSCPFASEVTLWQATADAVPMLPVTLASRVPSMGDWTELRRGLDISASGVILFEGIHQGVVTSGLAIPTTLVVEAPPVEEVLRPAPPQDPPRGKERFMALRDRLEKFWAHVGLREEKLARWEAVVHEWKAKHAR